MRTKIVAGNWKMNKTYQESKVLVKELKNAVKDLQLENTRVIIAPPFINLQKASKMTKNSVIEVAAQTGTALEVNSIPTRLDLDDIHVRRALALDVKVAINSDAHHPGGLDSMPFGLATARRGWATSPDVLNTMGVEDLFAWRQARISQQLSTKEGNHVAV